jgi:intracellular multiplication protein IcmO
MFSDPHKSAQAALVADGDAVDSLAVASIEMGVRRERSTCILVDHPDHLFITKDYVVTHNTESLLGFAANALSWGSGFLFCDGKGDVALFAKVYAMARRFGREDDLLVLNFMTGNTDLGSSGGEILSNTLNPFSTGSSDGLTQMVVSLMDDVGGDGAMWKGRATAMLTGIMRALCWLRDQGYLELNVGEIRDHMNLKRIIELADENKHPDLPPQIRKSIKSYLSSLPGFQEEKKEKQAQTTLDQHGYLEMQFTKILGSLADVYGHIFATPYGEVDMYDVVLGRRILVIMLPALEKSGDEIANLGKIVVATLKGMMGATLGSRLEGSWEEVVENRPTNSPSPFICILDEVGYYTVEGMALMAAQARSLGFSMVYASQDIGAMKRLNEKEAASIVGNTNTKIFMRIEDPNETTKLAVDRGDKALRVRVDGFERRVGEIMGSRHAVEGERGSFEETSRINATDLAAQGEGEMHILHQDIIVRARGFYANPEGALEKKKLRIRSNHFVKVPRPTLESIEVGLRGPDIIERLADPNTPVELAKDVEAALAGVQAAAEANDEIAMAARAFDRVLGAKRKPIEAACAAVAEVMQVLRGATGAFVEDVKGAYAAVPAAPGSFSLDDFETDIGGGFVGAGDPRGGFADAGARGGFAQEFEAADFDDGGYAESARGGKQGRRERFADPFGPPPGVTVPADAGRPPRRPPAPRKPHRVDPAVRHGATVDDGAIIDMADKIASNDAIMRSLAALEFDGDQVTSQQVEARIEEAIGSARKAAPEAMPERVDSFDRAAGAVRQSPAAGPAHKENTEGGDADGDGEGEFVASFLEGLLSDEE